MPERARDEREQQALGQQLAHQPAARGAERQAHRDLALADRGARQQQVRDVGARDQQHQPDDAQQQARGAHHVLAEAGVDRGLRERQERHVAAGVVVRVLLGELARERLQPGLGLRQRHAGLEPAGDVEDQRPPRVDVLLQEPGRELRVRHERHPQRGLRDRVRRP